MEVSSLFPESPIPSVFEHGLCKRFWYGYQFHCPDFDARLALAFRRKDLPYPQAELHLRGLDDNRQYVVTRYDEVAPEEHTGQELRPYLATIPTVEASRLMHYCGL